MNYGVDPILGFWKFWNSQNWSYWSAYVPTPIFQNIVIRVAQSTDLAKSLKTWCGGPRTMPGARRTNLSKCQANREIWAILDEITTCQAKNLSKCYFPLMILLQKKCSKKNLCEFFRMLILVRYSLYCIFNKLKIFPTARNHEIRWNKVFLEKISSF